MKRAMGLVAAVLVAGAAFAADGRAPDPARQAATAYLDAKALESLSAREAAVKKIASRQAALRRQAEVRAKILALIGGRPERIAPLNANVTGVHPEDGFTLETVLFDSAPDYRVTANVYVPAGKRPFPAVIVSPGHYPTGKANEYRVAANFARAGILVMTYDVVGLGERVQHYDPDTNESKLWGTTQEHTLAAYQSLLTGRPVARSFINDVLRGVDYLQSRADVDGARIGAFGCSGGGTVTAYAAALDPRIKVAASACFVTGMRDLLATIGPQEGEQSTPGFTAAGLDIADWVELAAPRPYAIVSTTEDMFPFAGARRTYGEAKEFWKLLGAERKLRWITGPGTHAVLAPVMPDVIAFFAENLHAAGGKPAFLPARPDRPSDMQVTATGQLSTSVGSRTIQSDVADYAKTTSAGPAVVRDRTALTALRRRLTADIAAVTGARSGLAPPAVETTASEHRDGYRRQTLRFVPADGPAYDGFVLRPDAPARGRLLYLDRSAAPEGKLEAFAKAGWLVLSLSPVGGNGETVRADLLGDYSLFALRAMLVDRTIVGMRLEQTRGAADWLAEQPAQGAAFAIYGVGALGSVALHAAVLDDRFTTVVVGGAQAAYRLSIDAPISRNLAEIALPGVLTKYDLPDLMTAAAPRRVLVAAPTDPLGRALRPAEFEALIAATRQSDVALGTPSRVQWLAYEPDAEQLAAP